MPNILAFGGGVDSTTLLAINLDRDRTAAYLGITRETLDERFPAIDSVCFSDPGAEFAATYANVTAVQAKCEAAGLPFTIVFKRDGNGDRLTITNWLTKNGTVPLMPGGPHACSLKFKGQVLQSWAKRTFPGQDVTWAIGIEADEQHRNKRFQAAKETAQASRFPLIELGLGRAGCIQLLGHLGWDVPVKSSCVFCPFMQSDEIENLYRNHPEDWAKAKHVEARFQATSAVKHQAWLDAGKPLSQGKRPRAPNGMWKKDSWADGQRLFVKTVNGKRLSVTEWEAYFTSKEEKAA